MTETLHIFSGRIYKIAMIRYVDVPGEVSKQFGGAAQVPVCGTVEGLPLRTTMVSRGNGCYRVAIHGDIRRKLRIDTGAIVEIALQLDEESREPALPPALVAALRHSPRAQAVFRGMTAAMRRQVVRYLTAVKQQTTLERRVNKFVRLLEKRGPAMQQRPKEHRAKIKKNRKQTRD